MPPLLVILSGMSVGCMGGLGIGYAAGWARGHVAGTRRGAALAAQSADEWNRITLESGYAGLMPHGDPGHQCTVKCYPATGNRGMLN